MYAPTVLHVDDDIDDAFFLREAFNTSVVNIRRVENGAQALDYLMGVEPYGNRLRYPLPDLVLLDINMPVVNGFELLQWLRQEDRFKALPIYMLSSSEDPADSARAKLLGATGYVVKQVGFREAASVVNSELEPLLAAV